MMPVTPLPVHLPVMKLAFVFIATPLVFMGCLILPFSSFLFPELCSL